MQEFVDAYFLMRVEKRTELQAAYELPSDCEYELSSVRHD